MNKPERTLALLSIIGRGKGKSCIEMLNAQGIRYHYQCVGHGTAPSEIMDIFGLGSNDKDIILSFAPEGAVSALSADFGRKLDTNFGYGGRLIGLSLCAINRRSAGIIARSAASQANPTEKGADTEMNNENKYHLIAITVNQGYTDAVMQTAKKAGATGGTVIRARQVDAPSLEQFGQPDAQEEKEIITIMAPVTVSTQIMEDVNREFGMNTEAQGMVSALPVVKTFKL